MFVLKKVKVFYWDVDRTLIMWEKADKWHPHEAHVDLLKQFHYQNHGNILWSAGGFEWASRAAKLLKIEHLVDIVVNKPDGYIDDKHVSEFITDSLRIFLPDKVLTDHSLPPVEGRLKNSVWFPHTAEFLD